MNDDLSLQTQLAVSDYWWFRRAAVNRNGCNAMITIISLPDLLCHVKWFKFICPTTEELSFKVTEHSIQFKDMVSSCLIFLSCLFPYFCSLTQGHNRMSCWEVTGTAGKSVPSVVFKILDTIFHMNVFVLLLVLRHENILLLSPCESWSRLSSNVLHNLTSLKSPRIQELWYSSLQRGSQQSQLL